MVLDASALLAFLHDEPGADRVQQAFDGGLVSAVNWAEVVQKALLRRADISGMRREFSEVGLVFRDFSLDQAETAARLWEKTRNQGLSLGDRACLTLAMEQQATVLTADRAWSELDLDIEVRLLR